jgi:hypothetical protein
MMTNGVKREPGGKGGGSPLTPPGFAAPRPDSRPPGNPHLDLEEPMTPPKSPDPVPVLIAPDAAGAQKLPVAVRKLLASTPEKDWPKIRAFLIESEEAGELVDMLPEMTRVMKYCPARLMGMVGKREITGDQLDKAYTQLHDSLHGVRQALHTLLHLAGFLDVRPREEAAPRAPGGAPEPEPRVTAPPAARPKAAFAT